MPGTEKSKAHAEQVKGKAKETVMPISKNWSVWSVS
ncbi:hypothetical protein EDE04_7420 [Streptomyces sp. 2132.2]|nr:hypothetical protein EDE04_7420 [Streptomyces sp. 2132.2]